MQEFVQRRGLFEHVFVVPQQMVFHVRRATILQQACQNAQKQKNRYRPRFAYNFAGLLAFEAVDPRREFSDIGRVRRVRRLRK